VSSEGACAAHYSYGRFRDRAPAVAASPTAARPGDPSATSADGSAASASTRVEAA